MNGPALAPGLRVFGSAQRYVQGPGALSSIGSLVAGHGPAAVLVLDAGVAGLVGPPLVASLEGAGVRVQQLLVDLEVTHANIEALHARVEIEGPATVIGVGGGKTLDLARALSWRRHELFVTVPTVASNDSPAAMAVAVYDEAGHMVEVIQTGRNPELVLVDTAVIAQAPPRFLAAGIGDAIAKKFEARSCRSVGGLNQHGTTSLRVTEAVADACYETLRDCAVDAMAAAREGRVDQALEDTVEATILMSALAFENGGLSIAHSLVRGLQAVRGARESMHGEHVAYGLLVQLALEGATDAELDDLAGFLEAVGLPTSLTALALPDPTPDELDVIADRCLGSPHRHKTGATVDRDSLLAAIARLEARLT